MKALFIFIMFIVGIVLISRVTENLGTPAAGICTIGGIAVLIYALNRFWRAGQSKNDAM